MKYSRKFERAYLIRNC